MNATLESQWRAGGIIPAILGLPILAVGCLILYAFVVGPQLASRAAASWTPVECTIETSRVTHSTDNEGNSSTDMELTYAYSVSGTRHHGYRFDFLDAGNRGYQSYEITEALPVGAVTPCYVDPADHRRSVIRREVPLWGNPMWSLAGLITLLTGLFVVGLGLCQLFGPASDIELTVERS